MTKKLPALIYLTLRLFALVSIASAAALAYDQVERYRQAQAVYPPGLIVAGIPVGGLDLSKAADRLTQAYLTVPLEIHYRGVVIQAAPASLGFSLDFGSMLGQAEVERTRASFWQGYWDYLWNHPSPSKTIPLAASVSEEQMRAYLKNEISTRLDDTPFSAAPVYGKVEYTPGQAGTQLNIDQAIPALNAALRSLDARQVDLNYNSVPPTRPGLENLQKMLEQIILLSGYQGTAEIYFKDLQTGQTIQLALDQGQAIPPGIAFTAASTMKIPIMISIFRRQPDPIPPDITSMLVAMIEFSDNDMSDRLIKTLDLNIGPVLLTRDIQALGLKDTFLAGYFYPGAPLLDRFETPANQRADISTAPDVYNQTTPTEMGVLLEGIYTCAEKDSGLLEKVFPNQITQSKCNQMIDLLSHNKNGALLEAGVPEGIRTAHKHGWTTESDSLIHAISDAGILYTPGGNYVMTVYLHTREQMLWDPTNAMVAWLSQAAYDFFNQP